MLNEVCCISTTGETMIAEQTIETTDGMTRRQVLAALSSIVAYPSLELGDQDGKFALPGHYKGKMVEVQHAQAVIEDEVQRPAIREMMSRGMKELTGETIEAAAWKRFFNPQDVVGVKVCPVGRPKSVSQPETLAEIVRGLQLAGVPLKNIVMFNRYQEEVEIKALGQYLPDGVKWEFAVEKYDDVQTDTKGYDTSVYVEFPKVNPVAEEKNPVHRRSHLCELVSKKFDKIINVGVLKDHASAGITMALKNIAHGFVNNVSRTHASNANNWCDIFIPAMVALKPTREKVVLHIGDGLIGTYDGGPGIWNPHFRTWNYGALFFATDPVAMDRIGWKILDEKRVREGLPILAETGKALKDPGHEAFDRRQPQHVLLAGKAGLGEADLNKIDHRVVKLG
jgi:hypothetical protein